ncbi:adenylate/guanylate cyclase domain-containing protein [Candidatus Uhrbacteria bacterium]|nr:adenylate/guanylate cyclase domain-containing protein [Candidatus Uhrbacteria bacterium]
MKLTREFFRPIAIGGCVGLLAGLGLLTGILQNWSNPTLDLLFLPHKPDPRLTLIAIDDASLTQIGRWPWPRQTHAQLIGKLKDAGATVIGYDVNFPEPSDKDDDQALAAALKNSANVVLPLELTLLQSRSNLTYDPKNVVQPIASLSSAAGALGFVNSPPDADNVFRRLPLTVKGPDGSVVPSFEAEVLRLAGTPGLLRGAPLDSLGRMRVNFSGPPAPAGAFRIISAADVLFDKTDLALLKGGIVLVGATAYDLHDNLLVPTSRGVPMSGVEVHASVLDTLLSRRWLQSVPDWLQAFYLIILGLFIGFMVPRVRARWSIPITLAVWFASILISFLAFDRGWLLDILWPTLTLVFAYAAVTLERRLASELQKRQLKTAFSRYVSPSVVEVILADPSKLKLGGERKNMSVLFSDICGFTSISEKLSPDKLVEILNKYLSRMTAIVFEESGVLDKYIGDAVMAFWNAPFAQPDHAFRAVATALKMQNVLDEMNAKKEFGDVEIRIGVGINTGDMVVGNVGGEARFDYTVIGDNVNLGSRLEALTRQYKVGVIVTEATYQAFGDRILARRLDKVAVKGKKEPVVIYEAIAETHEATEAQKKLAQDFEAALKKYFARDFISSAGACAAILSANPDDYPTSLLKERCGHFIQEPPTEDWDGTWVYTKK